MHNNITQNKIMSQKTINTTYPEKEMDLYNEIHRISGLTYKPAAQVSRELIRVGLRHTPLLEKLTPKVSY